MNFRFNIINVHFDVLGGRDYEYVGCSNSQMRSHGCWFVQPSWRGNAEDIRQWMGDLSRIRY